MRAKDKAPMLTLPRRFMFEPMIAAAASHRTPWTT
jgi:hypothetical protein